MALVCFFNSTHHICSQRQGWHRPWRKTCTLDWWICNRERYQFGFTSTQHHLPLFQFYVFHCFLLMPFQPSSGNRHPLTFRITTFKKPSFDVPTQTPTHPASQTHNYWEHRSDYIECQGFKRLLSNSICLLHMHNFQYLDNENHMCLRAYSVFLCSTAVIEAVVQILGEMRGWDGTHRGTWPRFTGGELSKYGSWLIQKNWKNV